LTRIQLTPKTSEKIVEVLIPLMIPLQKKAGQPSLGGGPEDVGAFLYWLMNRPSRKSRARKLVLSKKYQRVMKLLQALDAARTLQLARQLGQFS
jgi:hypothetical protein